MFMMVSYVRDCEFIMFLYLKVFFIAISRIKQAKRLMIGI